MARPTVWPIYVVAGLCFAISATLLAMFVVFEIEMSGGATGDEALVLIPFFVGLAAIRAGRAVCARAAGDDDGAEPTRSRRSRKARRTKRAAEPPRLGNDPFRDPPGRPPILIEQPAPPAPLAPIVPGDPEHAPKLLT
jgi:hypothetical protein